MKISKCQYFNDHQTVSCLMVDDLVPAHISIDESLKAKDDWGYLVDSENSLYTYFDQWILRKYPEIKGTIFLPLESHNYLDTDSGYHISTREIDSVYHEFLHRLSDKFEFAFHGLAHTILDKESNNILLEFSNTSEQKVEDTVSSVKKFTDLSGIVFHGGKFPGYGYDAKAFSVIQKLNCKWWALDATDINQIAKNDMRYSDEGQFIEIPTNITGDIFKTKVPVGILRRIKRKLINRYAGDPNGFLYYLYNNQLPIVVQEHFQNQGSDGRRQTPNIYDDIYSLDCLYGFLRGKDIWYANCTDIAHYYDCREKTVISKEDNKTFCINYDGLFQDLFLSIKADFKTIIRIENNMIINGFRKNGQWVFNLKECGTYKIAYQEVVV